jgi:hypothetical protein
MMAAIRLSGRPRMKASDMAAITITGLEPVIAKLKRIELIQNELEPPMKQALSHLHRRIARYPAKNPGAFAALATPVQRRAYWAKVRDDPSIHGPDGYQRTGNTARKFSTSVKRHSGGLTGELAGPPGARYVFGDYQPAFIKASGWPTVDSVAEKEAAAVQRYFNAAIRRVLAK